MRSLLIPILGLVLVTGCDQSTTLAPVETDPAFGKHEIQHTDTESGTFEVRGFEGCFGELVIATGTVRAKEHIMTSIETGNQDHSYLQLFFNGTAVGQTTGREWKFKETNKIKFNTPNLEAPHATESVRVKTHLAGPGGSVQLTFVLHFVITGQGVVKLVVEKDKSPC
jgi:hypothetical protein